MTSDTRKSVLPTDTLADLAIRHAGASRVFHKYGLDFCCHGQVALGEACENAALDLDDLRQELDDAIADRPDAGILQSMKPAELIDHILVTFHEPHRQELPRLIAMARKVEQVHGDKEACPRGLADHLARMHVELESHMGKEEQVLFPLLKQGGGGIAGAPMSVMRMEHEEHAVNLETLRKLTSNYTPPAEACGTWQALYLGVKQLQQDLMDHIHLENNVLFATFSES